MVELGDMVWFDELKLKGFFGGRSQASLLVRSGGFHASEVRFLAEEFLGGSLTNLILVNAAHEDGFVRVEEVRSLREKLSLGSFSSIGEKRLVIIDAKLRADAQNSVLKILEEPPKGVYFLLLAESGDFYLPTISSRCQVIFLSNAAEDEAVAYLKKVAKLNFAEAKLLFMQSGGSDKKLIDLVEDDELQKKSLELLKEAKEFLKANEFEKLVVLKKYSSKELLAEFVEALLVVLEIATKSSVGSALSLANLYEKLELVGANIKLNANVKLEGLGLVV